jgi:hypothetical protein
MIKIESKASIIKDLKKKAIKEGRDSTNVYGYEFLARMLERRIDMAFNRAENREKRKYKKLGKITKKMEKIK